jgi:hypothetical protein
VFFVVKKTERAKMSTSLLDAESPPEMSVRSFGEVLQASMSAVRLTVQWFGTRRSVTASQKHQAAETFDAESKFVSMGKKLIDTNHPAWKKTVAIRGQIQKIWRNHSLPYPEQGIRLIRRSSIASFIDAMEEARAELLDAERQLDTHYDELRHTARLRLGSLYNPQDYPAAMIGLFNVAWDFPNVEPPEYLRMISPSLFRQEAERIRNRFDEAVTLAEDAFFGELSKLVEHLTERLSGSDDGKPKIFRDTVVTNLLECFDRFKRLNIGSSEELEQMVANVQQIVGGITPNALRNSESLRNRIGHELTKVQASLDGLMVDRPRRNLIRRNGGSRGNRD